MKSFRVALFGIIIPLVAAGFIAVKAQEPAASPEASLSPPAAVIAPAPTPTVVQLGGEPAAIVPAPAGATSTEIHAVAEQSQDNLRAVAENKVSIAEATRDPTSGAPDPGNGGMFWLLSIVFGAVIRPLTDIVVGKLESIDNRLAGPVNTGVLLGTYIGAWAVLHGSNPDLPQSVMSWIIAGFAAAGLGSATTQSVRAIGAAKP